MRDSLLTLAVIAGLSAVLAGCGSSAPSLTTGSLFGSGGSAEAAAVAPQITPRDRALHVAAVSARAQRCGFNFDPEQMRAGFLAAEQQAGTPADQLARVQQEYDYTRGTIATAIGKEAGYCTEGRAREIKADLTRHLAGDFNPPRRALAGGGFLDTAGQGRSREVFNPEALWDKSQKQTKRVEY